jgi:hypothetical protein
MMYRFQFLIMIVAMLTGAPPSTIWCSGELRACDEVPPS